MKIDALRKKLEAATALEENLLEESGESRKRIYLAGPDVFYDNAEKMYENKELICGEWGYIGMSPVDNNLDFTGLTQQESGLLIYQSNIELMMTCDACIANMTPFRGPSMDVGTAFEMGFMKARGVPVVGYTDDKRFYTNRVPNKKRLADGSFVDQHGMLVESFRFHDNLMLDGAIMMGGFHVEVTGDDEYWSDAFRRCVDQLASIW